LPAQLVAVTERHHERLDGSGYPSGLAGAAIDQPSLLCAIADVHTALTDRRPYREPLTDDEAFARMRELGGRQLDLGLLRRYEQVVRDTRPAAAAGADCC
jgi:HD-GYP domain-containing protein (c-di-GMP phosphodiesterase class II)